MPKKVEWYRLNAERCHQLAQTFTGSEAKRTVSVMADSWLMLAAHRILARTRHHDPAEPSCQL